MFTVSKKMKYISIILWFILLISVCFAQSDYKEEQETADFLKIANVWLEARNNQLSVSLVSTFNDLNDKELDEIDLKDFYKKCESYIESNQGLIIDSIYKGGTRELYKKTLTNRLFSDIILGKINSNNSSDFLLYAVFGGIFFLSIGLGLLFVDQKVKYNKLEYELDALIDKKIKASNLDSKRYSELLTNFSLEFQRELKKIREKIDDFESPQKAEIFSIADNSLSKQKPANDIQQFNLYFSFIDSFNNNFENLLIQDFSSEEASHLYVIEVLGSKGILKINAKNSSGNRFLSNPSRFINPYCETNFDDSKRYIGIEMLTPGEFEYRDGKLSLKKKIKAKLIEG